MDGLEVVHEFAGVSNRLGCGLGGDGGWWLAASLGMGATEMLGSPGCARVLPPPSAIVWTAPAAVLAGAFTLTTLALSVADAWPRKPTTAFATNAANNAGFVQRYWTQWDWTQWYDDRLIRVRRSDGRGDSVPPGYLLAMCPVVLRNMAFSAFVMFVCWNLRVWAAAQNWGGWVNHNNASTGTASAAFSLLDARLDVVLAEWVGVAGLWTSCVPAAVRWLAQVALLKTLSELWFYHVHRWVHAHPAVFRFVHAMHHRHLEPVALTAIHCTLSEMLLLNIPAAILGPLLVLPDTVPHAIWMLLVGTYTPVAHSGHNFGLFGLYDGQFHDDHHRFPDLNYGSNTLDRIHGSHSALVYSKKTA